MGPPSSVNETKESPFKGATKLNLPKINKLELLRRLLDPNEPWVITPNGSMFGYFDFLPLHYRIGPWTFLMPFYIITLITITIYYKPESLSENMEHVYPEAYSKWWYYNVIVGLWTSAFLWNTLTVRSWTLIMYTVQSWIYITLRHVVTVLAPFLTKNDHHFLLSLNEFLRFPSLVTATVTFTMWNFFIAPGIYLHLDTPEKRKDFLVFNFSMRLVQLHGCNIIFAVLNTVSVSPRRFFTFEDLWCAFSLAVLYNLFYFFILDRLGIHLYPMFTPRSNMMFIFAVLTWVVYYSAFFAWNKAMETGILSFGD